MVNGTGGYFTKKSIDTSEDLEKLRAHLNLEDAFLEALSVKPDTRLGSQEGEVIGWGIRPNGELDILMPYASTQRVRFYFRGIEEVRLSYRFEVSLSLETHPGYVCLNFSGGDWISAREILCQLVNADREHQHK